MTVHELIERLRTFPGDLPVVVNGPYGDPEPLAAVEHGSGIIEFRHLPRSERLQQLDYVHLQA